MKLDTLLEAGGGKKADCVLNGGGGN